MLYKAVQKQPSRKVMKHGLYGRWCPRAESLLLLPKLNGRSLNGRVLQREAYKGSILVLLSHNNDLKNSRGQSFEGSMGLGLVLRSRVVAGSTDTGTGVMESASRPRHFEGLCS